MLWCVVGRIVEKPVDGSSLVDSYGVNIVIMVFIVRRGVDFSALMVRREQLWCAAGTYVG